VLVTGTDQDFNDLIILDQRLSNGLGSVVPLGGVWTSLLGPYVDNYTQNDWVLFRLVVQYTRGAAAGFSAIRVRGDAFSTGVIDALNPASQFIPNLVLVAGQNEAAGDVVVSLNNSLAIISTSGQMRWIVEMFSTNATLAIAANDLRLDIRRLPA
jgi:hypothetical protein